MVAPAGTAVGVPATRAADTVDPVPVRVVKTTCGTTRAVEMTVVELDEGMTEPCETPVDSVHATVKVVRTWTVVTGMV